MADGQTWEEARRIVRAPGFAQAAHEQSLAMAAADRAHPEVQDWIDAMHAEVWDDE